MNSSEPPSAKISQTSSESMLSSRLMKLTAAVVSVMALGLLAILAVGLFSESPTPPDSKSETVTSEDSKAITASPALSGSAPLLPEAGADVNAVNSEQFYDQTPLSLAIGKGDKDIARKLIAAGADPNRKISPAFRVGTHLTYAVGLGDREMAQILLDAGADVNVVDTEQFYDESPLSIAVKAQDAEMVRLLVNAGADPNQKLDQFYNVSPLEIAIEGGLRGHREHFYRYCRSRVKQTGGESVETLLQRPPFPASCRPNCNSEYNQNDYEYP